MIKGKDIINVWEDTYVEYSGDTLYFRVKKDNEPVYEGYAERFPDGTPIRIYINRIARDYLFNGVFDPTVTGLTVDSGACGEFSVFSMSGVTEQECLGSIVIVYGFEGDAVNGTLNEPVNTHADMRQQCFLSYLNYPLPDDPEDPSYLPQGYVTGIVALYEIWGSSDSVAAGRSAFASRLDSAMLKMSALTEDETTLYPYEHTRVVKSEIRPWGSTGWYYGFAYSRFLFEEPVLYPGRIYYDDYGNVISFSAVNRAYMSDVFDGLDTESAQSTDLLGWPIPYY